MTTQIAFGRACGFGDRLLALVADETLVAENVAAAAQSTSGAPDFGEPALARVATDTAVYVSFGVNPDASSDANRLLCPADTISYAFVAPGSKASVAATS